ncbi:spore germination protein KB [Natronincola peptidivorans]|uniref:Spore germination protein KB n=1 Tax=Natronincola peptidivorans TaxID=426128 RepID=A0A1I0E688_9FIRM|nr:endospore germination permease [Natronincola peptidivorans]SET40683.1 spore germination protein KB [Natronincola peptidivorans]
MGKQLITTKQAISILIFFLLGTALVLTPGAEAKQDVWIVLLLAMAAALPMYFIYGRILYLFPDKDLYSIANQLFGAVLGRMITLFYIWYAIHLGALIFRNFSEFVQIVTFINTPQTVTIIAAGVTIIVFCKSGIEAIGRWASFMLPVILILFLNNMIFSIPNMNIDHLKPVLFEGMEPVMGSVFTVLSFPFLEAVLFIGVFNTLKEKEKIYKVFFIGLLISGLLGLGTNLRNLLTMGVDLVQITYFPTYTATKLIGIGELLERTEITIAVALSFFGLIKVSICVLVASKGIASFFSLSDHKSVIVPVTLVMMSLASLLYGNVMEMFDWAINIYRYYAIPFQFILPLLIYAAAELRVRRSN